MLHFARFGDGNGDIGAGRLCTVLGSDRDDDQPCSDTLITTSSIFAETGATLHIASKHYASIGSS